MADWEVQVLRDHTEMLEVALVPELFFVAHEMNKAYLLSDTELEEIKAVPSLLTCDQKAGKIVSTVKRMVQLSSSNFEKFVDILEKKPQIFETILSYLSRDGSPPRPSQDSAVEGKGFSSGGGDIGGASPQIPPPSPKISIECYMSMRFPNDLLSSNYIKQSLI